MEPLTTLAHPGTYSVDGAMCGPCEKNSEIPNEDRTACTPCPYPKYYDTDTKDCEQCKPGRKICGWGNATRANYVTCTSASSSCVDCGMDLGWCH